ncbi:callose synthase 7 isoform X2 [Amborella trichopoda]|uniref:callose synthase 7 isoform X2 n=1 Tax=Amborella trichopoda TaxID=13333 RepID=UPI0009BFDFC9|nr:callose synthase 7 isoform X2 [Amborella trichopoda]|eukprot:XP_020523271.1 callose synthase 7 isoform X2 [Amborella trichopoda]
MASSSGTKPHGEGPARMPLRKVTWSTTMVAEPKEEVGGGLDSENVPSSLASIVPILRVADEIEPINPRVAYLCRFHAFEKAHYVDPKSSGRHVRQFKTNLLHKLEKDEEETKPILAKTDPREIQKFYQQFYEENVKEGPVKRKPEEMAKNYQIATVLYDVLRTVVPHEKVDDEINRYAKEVELKKEHYVQYNILPLHTSGATQPVMELPEIKAAVNALRKIDNLPQLSPNALRTVDDKEKSVHDLLEWLGVVFGFQDGNVANQREHLILLLANVSIRKRSSQEENFQLDGAAVGYVKDKIFKNYLSCVPTTPERQQLELMYIALYLLIWGEASNLRFMPECLCYVFHKMADELYGILLGKVSAASGGDYKPAYTGEEAFLHEVVTPIYNVVREEAKKSKGGTASHSKWRNYDDLNEYFWSDKCFKIGWPMNLESDFFVHSRELHAKDERHFDQRGGERKPKTNFVEVRTFFHLFRSFDRMWIFFILAFQAMVIIAWSPQGSITALINEDVFKSVSSIFITAAVLNFLQATLDIILSWKAWGSMAYSQILRYILKLVVAAAWVIILPIGYASSWKYPTGLVKFFSNLSGNWRSPSFYVVAVVLYMIPNILAVILFMFPPIRRAMEHSNWRIIIFLMWWAQPKLYVGRGMHEGIFTLLKYTLFWILLLISKLAFSYYVEISPLIRPTKIIMDMTIGNYEWHEFFPNVKYNIGVVISIWAPIVLVYFMDVQIWYAIFSTLVGGVVGAFSRLGEIRTLGMLRSRFESVPLYFSNCLVPYSRVDRRHHDLDETGDRKNVAKFSQVWNAFIICLRKEDLINNREMDLLLVPYSSGDIPVVQWPPFLLASKIPIALDMAKDFSGKEDTELFKKFDSDPYMHSAVIECYETLKDILYRLVVEDEDGRVIRRISEAVDTSIVNSTFLIDFQMSGLPELSNKLEKLLVNLKSERWHKGESEDFEKFKAQTINLIQDIMEIITRDIMTKEHAVMEGVETSTKQKFTMINFHLTQDRVWMEKVFRLHLLLTVKESAINVPMNLDARRRITFFANSLFMKMPKAPQVRNMLSFSVLTPYYKEDVLYSENELNKENEDGISILFYLQKIYPDEWKNFLERIGASDDDLSGHMEQVSHWVSYRGQTLTRTVRGMMYYRQALELQCFLDTAEDHDLVGSYRSGMLDMKYHAQQALVDKAQAVADIKFTYVVSCQVYGVQKKSEGRDRNCYLNILNLMLKYPSLRVAYIDEREEKVNEELVKIYYSVLVKGGEKLDEEIYRIKLPGPPTVIGEGKPENQNHAIIFTRGEALQTIDMNQDNYLEEAFKMRNVLEEFQRTRGRQPPTILGLREHIFTGSVSSLAWFMSNQETSFVTIGQRVLANPLKGQVQVQYYKSGMEPNERNVMKDGSIKQVRFHYGHPDVFDRIFHLTRGGVSKASRIINLSEDIFSGFNSTLRGGVITHHEYMQVGKGRDVGMNQISQFEAKVSNGNGEQTLSRDVYRLGRRFDFYRMLSFYVTTVGFYFSSMVTVLTVYVFLYGRLYLVLSGLERAILEDANIQQLKLLEAALASQSVFQLGLLLVLPMVMEIGLERGFRTALGDFIIMQLQLASVFFTFQLGTKAHYYGRTILHGGAKYRATGRGFVVFHAKFGDNYRMYSRSHFVKGLELMILLVVYQVYGHTYRSSNVYLFITLSMWFLVASWLFAPFLFNPSGFDWQKTVDDWTDWKRWMGNRGGIGIQPERSWESWWNEEQAHLRYTDIRGRVLEILLALRFLIYQYGIVYHLNIAHHSKSVLVYGLSWLVMATVMLVLKMVSVGRTKFGTDFQLMFRILKGLLFIGFVCVLTILFVVCGLTVSDLFAGILAFMPTGWAFILIGQASRSLMGVLGLWDSIKELARTYEYVMGIIVFVPIAVLAWFPFVSEFQTRLLFNQAFSRGLQISMILAGKDMRTSK